MRKISTKIAAMMMAMLMVIGLVPSAVFAAPTINMDAKGSITIVKEAPELDEDGNPTADKERIGDVIFHQWKVADIEQVKNDDDAIVVAYTNLNEDLTDLMDTDAPAPDFTIGTKNYYYASTLQGAIESLYALGNSQDALKALIEGEGVAMDPTADGLDALGDPDPSEKKGTTKATALPVGLYLFVETEWPAEITRPCVPFFVSMPSNTTVDADDHASEYDQIDWRYDITAVPKNERQTLNVDKWILNESGGATDLNPGNDTLSKGEDYQIGDTVPYRIEADVPASIVNLQTYTIGDQLSTGLTLKAVGKVYGVKGNGTSVLLADPTNYKVITTTDPGDQVDVVGNDGIEMGKSTFAIQFLPATLGDYVKVYVEYTAILNEDAAIYTVGNPNHVSLNYSKNTGSEEGGLVTVKPGTPEPVVYTYKVKVTKQMEIAKDIGMFDGVEFELQDMNGVKIPVSLVSGTDYIVSADGTGNAKITVNGSGEAQIIGLNAGQYQLVETGTAEGHTLLSEAIIININAKFKGEKFIEKADGAYFKVVADETYYVNGKEIDMTGFAIGDFAEMAGEVREGNPTTGTVVQKYIHETNATGSEHNGTITSNHDIIGGVISFTVINKAGFDLPSTGGMGTYIFTIGGLLLVVAATVMLLGKKKEAK